MRIKQNKLKEPDFIIIKFGITAEFYSKPCFCMRIIKTSNNKQCYPIAADVYTGNMPDNYETLIGKHDACIATAMNMKDERVRAFYKNAADEYKRRAYALEWRWR